MTLPIRLLILVLFYRALIITIFITPFSNLEWECDLHGTG